jgi:hypothetical protein
MFWKVSKSFEKFIARHEVASSLPAKFAAIARFT